MSNKLSVYLCQLLRHQPEKAGLHMDVHGWVSVEELIDGVNRHSSFHLDRETLETLVAEDEKGRYRFDEPHARIRCCQGHSIPWVEPMLTPAAPPARLYHGTTTEAAALIDRSGAIEKMTRHAVHMQADTEKAWASAVRRRNKTPVLLVIDAARMARDGFAFAVSDNGVWCTERVPAEYICGRLYALPDNDMT